MVEHQIEVEDVTARRHFLNIGHLLLSQITILKQGWNKPRYDQADMMATR